MNFNPIAKLLILSGLVLIVLGVAWQTGIFNHLRLGHLPGDIVIERENTKIYIPIVTMLLVSLILSILSWIFRR